MNNKDKLNDELNKKRYTIKDIAEIAGVTPATVSLVINNKKGVSETTRIRVMAIIEKLDYIPSAIARGLVSRKTKTLGLIISNIADPFFAELTKGVEDAGFKKGYSLIVCNSDESIEKERLYVSLMIEQHAAGIIIVPVTDDHSCIELASRANIPVVIADRETDLQKAGYVASDNFGGAYKLTSYLLSLGHTRIACVRTVPEVSTTKHRLDGYKKALKDYNIPINDELIVSASNTIEGGSAIAERVLNFEPRPTAIVGNNDYLALGIISTTLKNGIRVPQDISITGFDNIRFSELAKIPLTTVEQPKYKMGSAAFELILDRIERETQNRCKLFDTKLIIRNSTDINPEKKVEDINVISEVDSTNEESID